MHSEIKTRTEIEASLSPYRSCDRRRDLNPDSLVEEVTVLFAPEHAACA